MFGKTPGLKALEVRKQLLLAESEVNRTALLEDFNALKAAVHAETDRVKKQVRTAGSIASSAALLVAGFSFFRHRQKTAEPDGSSKVPWITAALEGARAGASLFFKVKSYLKDRQ
jgi:hypothetical protein